MKIGNVEIKGRTALAPMAGVTDRAFRELCVAFGASYVVGEMVSAKGISFNSERSKELMLLSENERPAAVQLFGSEPQTVAAAAVTAMEYKPDIIDINMGCPVPKVAIKNQAGSALLKNPEKVYEIVSSVVNAVNVPVTVKIRSGWDNNSINAVEIAKMIERAGASAITVHPRTRAQGYTGNADWNIIKAVKENVTIPVIGNGDIRSCYDAKRMLEETKCDAVMIGRGVLGNPWLIKECVEYLATGKEPIKVSLKEKMDMVKRHYKLLEETKGEKLALLEMRTHAAWYLKGLENSTKLKEAIFKTKTKEEFLKLIDDFIEQND